MVVDRNLSQIRAEVLLNYLYPEMEDEWIAHCRGTFFRNYSYDILEVEEDEKKVRLSRDGFVKLLPEGLLARDDELKGENAKEKYKELEFRRELLIEAFMPFDTYVFRKKLVIERQASELLQNKLEFLLKNYFGFDLATVTNPLVKEAAVLLPFVSRWRGDFGFVSNLLGALMNCEVEMYMGRYSHIDTTICWLPKVRYELLISGLSSEEYRQLDETMQPLREFIIEWLIPFDVKCEMVIKEHKSPQRTNTRITLGYNSELVQ